MLPEAALTIIARAVISQASTLAAGSLGTNLRARVHGGPVERAVAGALGEALKDVEGAHPGVRAALFDQLFLERRGAPILARLLVPGDAPGAEELAAAWSTQFLDVGEDRYAGDEILAAASDLLVAFERALDARGRQKALGGLRSQRAAHATADAASQFASWATGQRQRALIDPQRRYRELDLDRFAGRAWLVEQVDEFLRCRESGYFVLEGAAGIGKSSFLAWLARDSGYPVHFVRLGDGRDDTAAALSNLAVQLADTWQVEGPVSLHGPDVRPHEFYEVLAAIAHTRARRGRSDPVVIVIDGLDEVQTSSDDRGNVLGLPARPPEGVYFIVSQRPVNLVLNVESLWRCTVRPDDERHLRDLRGYVEVACRRPSIATALRNADITDDAFVASLTRESGGVWLYVHHILAEVELGVRDVSRLEDLPAGLWAYYASQCDRVRRSEPARWERLDLPVLATLAAVAAQEPVEQKTLAVLAGVEDSPTFDDLIATWAPFLERDGEAPYRLYHDTMRRFLSGEVAQDAPVRERRAAARLATATSDAHARIADHFLDAWGGVNDGLPALRDPRWAGMHGGYGVRHVAAHLYAIERYDDLRALLLAEWPSSPRPLNAWYEAHAQAGDHNRYLVDVGRARRLAESRTDRALAAREDAATAGDEYGYALLAGSLASHSENVPPELRAALLQHAIWSPERTIADAQSLADPDLRAHALLALAEHVSLDERVGLVDDALDAAREIHDADDRADALAAVATHGGIDRPKGKLFDEALAAAREIDDGYARSEFLGALAGSLSPEQLGDALAAVLDIRDEEDRVDGLTWLVAHLRPQHLDTGLDAADDIVDEWLRARALATLAPYLDARQLDEAVRIAGLLDDSNARVHAVGALAGHLRKGDRGDLLAHALDTARGIGDAGSRAVALGALAVHLGDSGRSRVLGKRS